MMLVLNPKNSVVKMFTNSHASVRIPKSEGNSILAKIMYDIKPMNRAIPELKKIANVLRTIRFCTKGYPSVSF